MPPPQCLFPIKAVLCLWNGQRCWLRLVLQQAASHQTMQIQASGQKSCCDSLVLARKLHSDDGVCSSTQSLYLVDGWAHCYIPPWGQADKFVNVSNNQLLQSLNSGPDARARSPHCLMSQLQPEYAEVSCGVL